MRRSIIINRVAEKCPSSTLNTMAEMYKIRTGKSAVDPNTWFKRVKRDGLLTRQAADPLNVKIPAARLSARVCEKENNRPNKMKDSVNIKSFKAFYRRHRGSNPSQTADRTGQDARE
jgi:hypothetical protein